MTEFEGTAQIVQQDIDEIIKLRASNKQLLEALKLADIALSCMEPDWDDCQRYSNTMAEIREIIRKAEEQALHKTSSV